MNENIQKELKRSGNKEYAARLRKYFKAGKGEYGEGDRFLGIQVPVLRKIAKKYRSLSIDEVSELIRSQFHEERLFSLFVLGDIFKRANDKDKKIIYTVYLSNTKFINNWDLVDASAGNIVGAYLLTRDKESIYVLARSKNVWERRISIMSTSYFIQYNRFVDTLNVAEMLLGDEEDLIHKAVGWMLREIGKRDFALEERFLGKYYKCMPRTMLRYAIEKFPEEKRKSYLRGEL
jgi:3-methyladenine DNA glycosylase AlkD